MIELRTLGSVEVRHTDGRAAQSVLTQPKRLALLVYLAVANPGGFHRRDSLLGLFWPEMEESRARNALSQALHVLRRSLGEQVILTRGEGEVGLDEARIGCDAVAFERAVDAGELEEGLALYRGEFLEGFYISDAPEWERWVYGVRDRLRQKAMRAAWTLAEQREAAGDLAGSTARWRWLAARDPHSSRVTVQLMQALAAAGDRSGALKQAQLHAELLREELEAEPAPEVIALAERLRTRPAPATPLPQEGGEGSENGRGRVLAADAAGAEDSQEIEAELPGSTVSEAGGEEPRTATSPKSRRDTARIALLALLLVALILGVWRVWEARGPTRVAVSPTRVAVFPFAFRGSAEFAYLGEGIVDLLSTNLDGAGELRSVDPHALLTFLAREPAELVNPARGRAVARQFGAGLYVLGEIVEVEGQVRIRGALYSANPAGEPLVRAAVEGSAADIFRLVDELTAQLLVGRLAEPGAQLARVAALTTSSLPALRAYLEGENHFRSQRHRAAIASLQQAIAHDSSFALAHYRLSVVADWAERFALSREAILHAVRYSERLPERHRLLVEALLAWHRVQPNEAERLYRTVLARYPDDVEAWYRLGEVFFHYNPLRGRSIEESWSPFERVLALDPDHQGALIHLATLAAYRGDAAALDRFLDRLLVLTPADSLEWLTLRAFSVGDRPAQERVMPELRESTEEVLFSAARYVIFHTENMEGASRLSRLLTEPHRSPELRVAGHVFLAHLELAQGRWSGAQRELAQAERLRPASALAFRALLSSVHFLPLPPAHVEATRDELARWQTTAVPNPYVSWYSDLRPQIRQYLLGILSARLQDHEAALRYATQLEQADDDPARAARGRAMAAAVRARVAFTRGEAAEALGWLDRVGFDDFDELPLPPFGTTGYQRHLRPELLREVGREREALRWYGAIPWISAIREHSLLESVHLAPWKLGRAELYEHFGEREAAIRAYERFLELWREADPELQPKVGRAEGRLAALRGR